MTTIQTDPTVGPCPSWRTLTSGHRWDSIEHDDSISRGHGDDDRPNVHGVTDRDQAWTGIGAREVAGVGLGPVTISMSAEGDFTAEQARSFAAQVLEVADQLDEVATVGTTKREPMFSPASSGRVHALTRASRAELACRLAMPGSARYVRGQGAHQ